MKIFILTLFLLIAQLSIAQNSFMTRADSLFNLGYYSEAINQYALVNSEKASLQIARAFNANRNYKKAVLQYEDIIAKDSASQIARFELGKLLFKLKRFSNASELFFSLVSDQASNPEFDFYLGRTLFEMNNIDEGIPFFKSAILKDSSHLRSIFELSKYYLTQNTNDSVLKYVNMGLRIYQDDVSLINLKALALYNENDYEKAIPLLERLLTLGEEKAYIFEKLAFSFFKTWKLSEAKQNYFLLLNYEPAIPDALNGLGHTYWREQKLDSAEYYFKMSIAKQKPNLANEYTSLAQLARQRNDLEEAMTYYKKAYTAENNSPHIYYQICVLADQLYKDSKIRLEYYQYFLEKFGAQKSYYSEFARKRVMELKEEIHFAVD